MFQDVSVIPDIPAAKSQVDPLFQAAEVLFQHQDFDNLKKIAADILQRDSRQPKAIFYLSKYFENREQHANQEKCLEKLLQLDLSATNVFEYANFLYSRNRLDESIQIIQENISSIKTENNNDLFDLYRLMGNISLKMQDIETAEEYYNICLRINPRSDVIFSNLGSLYLHRSDFSKSIDNYEKALALNQKNSKAWMGLALCHLSQKDSQLFWGNIKNAIECNPYDVNVVQIALDQALVDFEYDTAISVADVYLQKYPFDIPTTIKFASLLFQVGSLERAQLEVVKVMSYDQDNADALQLYNLIEAEYVRMANKR